VLLASVGHTAVHVDDWGDVVLVVAATVVEVDEEVEALLLHATAPTENATSTAATPRRPFVMVPSCLQTPGSSAEPKVPTEAVGSLPGTVSVSRHMSRQVQLPLPIDHLACGKRAVAGHGPPST